MPNHLRALLLACCVWLLPFPAHAALSGDAVLMRSFEWAVWEMEHCDPGDKRACTLAARRVQVAYQQAQGNDEAQAAMRLRLRLLLPGMAAQLAPVAPQPTTPGADAGTAVDTGIRLTTPTTPEPNERAPQPTSTTPDATGAGDNTSLSAEDLQAVLAELARLSAGVEQLRNGQPTGSSLQANAVEAAMRWPLLATMLAMLGMLLLWELLLRVEELRLGPIELRLRQRDTERFSLFRMVWRQAMPAADAAAIATEPQYKLTQAVTTNEEQTAGASAPSRPANIATTPPAQRQTTAEAATQQQRPGRALRPATQHTAQPPLDGPGGHLFLPPRGGPPAAAARSPGAPAAPASGTNPPAVRPTTPPQALAATTYNEDELPLGGS